jgi:integrase
MSELLLDAAGRRRSPATLPEFHAGRPPRNKGIRYPADPPTIEEIVTVMRRAGDTIHGRRLRGLIVVLWRAGLRIHEALALAEADLDPRRGSLLVRRGKGGRRREVGMDERSALALVAERPAPDPVAPAGSDSPPVRALSPASPPRPG